MGMQEEDSSLEDTWRKPSVAGVRSQLQYFIQFGAQCVLGVGGKAGERTFGVDLKGH